jgi:site-specific DNA recombinase
VASPSAHDPERNRHRSSGAWSKSAVRAILNNPRYTGRQVWNRQPKHEILIDVEDVALGHRTQQRWNDPERWIWSDQVVHEPVIDTDLFQRAHAVLNLHGGDRTTRQRTRVAHVCTLRARLGCDICGRRMQGQVSHGEVYYRCRYRQEYALGGRSDHPRNVYLAERDVIGPLDRWLATAFDPASLDRTVAALHQAQPEPDEQAAQTARALADFDRRLARHRAALEAGADPGLVTGWIQDAKLSARRPLPRPDRRRLTVA